jgi:LysR family carnitine catabolism transcriptional activator
MIPGRNISIHELRVFTLVATLQSFTKAAAALNLTQPGLSMAMRQLEAKLGAPLFDRGKKAALLSPVGSALLPSAERLIENFDRTVAGMVEVSSGRTGRIAIACPEGVAAQVIAPALRVFVEENPGVIVSLFDGDATSVEHMMHARVADFGLTGYWAPHPDFDFEPLVQDRCCIICPTRHRFAKRSSIEIVDLEGEPIVALNRDAGVRRLIEREALAKGVKLNIRFEVARVSTLTEMVISHQCISMLTDLSRPRHIDKEIRSVPLFGDMFSYPVGIVTPAKRMLTASASSFIATLKSHVSGRAQKGLEPSPVAR